MSVIGELIAQIIPDNPWLVRMHVARDLYVPREYKYSTPVNKDVMIEETMSAQKAREEGIDINPNIDDDEEVTVMVERTITVDKKWSEVRLRRRNRNRSHPITVRTEMADAASSPLSFVNQEKVTRLLKSEIQHWEHFDMSLKKIKPLVAVFLGTKEDDSDHVTFCRQMFVIKSYDMNSMTVLDNEDNLYKLSFGPDVYSTCRIHCFILFFPANVVVVDSNTGKQTF